MWLAQLDLLFKWSKASLPTYQGLDFLNYPLSKSPKLLENNRKHIKGQQAFQFTGNVRVFYREVVERNSRGLGSWMMTLCCESLWGCWDQEFWDASRSYFTTHGGHMAISKRCVQRPPRFSKKDHFLPLLPPLNFLVSEVVP